MANKKGNAIDGTKTEIDEEVKKPTKKMVEMAGEIFDIKYLINAKRNEKYDENMQKMKYGILFNNEVPEMFSLKDYQIWFPTYEIREKEWTAMKTKLLLLNIEII
jgi:hypothetical protein